MWTPVSDGGGLQSRLLELKWPRPGFQGAGPRVLGGIRRPSSAVGRRPASSQTQALPSANGKQPASSRRPSCLRAGGGAAAAPGAAGEQRRAPQVRAPRLLWQITRSGSPGPRVGRDGGGADRGGVWRRKLRQDGSLPEVERIPSNRLRSEDPQPNFPGCGSKGIFIYEHLGGGAATLKPVGLREEASRVQET